MSRVEKKKPGWVVWFVGLPGAGKTRYARAVYHVLRRRGDDFSYLSMDDRRRVYFPLPGYTEEEREKAYWLFAEEAARIARQGENVIMDGTGPRLHMRRHARTLVPRFAEVLVRCPLETAMHREASRPQGLVTADLYRKALERKRTGKQLKGLGEVIGVDTPFEEDPAAECVIESDRAGVQEGRDLALSVVERLERDSGQPKATGSGADRTWAR